jgi:hypothetical protein
MHTYCTVEYSRVHTRISLLFLDRRNEFYAYAMQRPSSRFKLTYRYDSISE